MIRVLLGQKGTLFRGALAAVLAREKDIEVAAEVGHAEEVLPAALREQPQVAVLDYMLQTPAAVEELCRQVCRRLPRTGVLLLLDRRANAGAGRALAKLAPRVGFIATESSPSDLVAGVRRLARGEPVLDTQLAVAALGLAENPLTDRECEVLRLAGAGAPPAEIARTLALSAGTVRNYLSRVVTKTGARTRIEAIRIAQESGWI